MIRGLKLVGWKSHEKTEVDLSSGTNVLVGIMGSGKSSILQGLTFGLFGEVPEVRSRKLSNSGLIMRKPRRLESATVEVEFDVGGVIYKVQRKVSESGDAKLFREGKILEVGVRRVTEKIVELLGTDYDTFVNVVYARQNDIDNFLRHGKSDRVKMIDGLLRIDKLEDARKKLRSFHTGVKSKLEDLKKKASKDVSTSKEMLADVEEKIEAANGELSDLQSVVSSLKEKLSVRRLKFQEMDRLRTERGELNSRVNRLEGERDSLEDRMSGLPEIPGAGSKLRAGKGKLETLREKESRMVAGLADLKSRGEQIGRRLDELFRYRSVSRRKVDDPGGELEKLQEEASYLLAQKDSHSQSVEHLKSAKATCPVCGSPIKDPKKHQERHREALSAIDKKLSGLGKKIEGLRARKMEADALRLEIEKAKEMIKQIPGLKKELEAIDTESLGALLKKTRGRINTLEKEVGELEKAVEREEASGRLEKVKSELSSLYRSLKSLGFDEPEYSRLREDVENLGSELSANMTRMQVIPKLIEAKQSEAAALRREIDEVGEAKKEFERTEGKMESLAVLINSLSEVQIRVRQDFLELVNEILGDIWSQLYPYGDYSSLRIYVESDGRKAGDYVLQLRERREWVNVDGIASGGERSIASLALRVAFAKALSRLGLLLLDEPTHNLDDNGIDKLTDVLREGMPSVLEQVVIITHEERMEKSATGAAYRLIRDKETEEPSRLERL